MNAKPLFDTLSYAKMLEKGGVTQSDIHAKSLARALQDNIYTKDEIDMRFEKALSRFDKTLNEFRNDMREIELRFEKAFNRYLVTTISVLGSLIVVVGAIATFAHALFH